MTVAYRKDSNELLMKGVNYRLALAYRFEVLSPVDWLRYEDAGIKSE